MKAKYILVVTVNRPTITYMGVPREVHEFSLTLFTVNHNGGRVHWETSGSITMSDHPELLYATFASTGNHFVIAHVTNECGTTTERRNFLVTNTSPVLCSFCGTPSHLPPGCVRCLSTGPISPFRYRENESREEIEIEEVEVVEKEEK